MPELHRDAVAPLLFIVGDIHLDGRSNAFLTFLDLLSQRQAGRLVILGDLFDYWLDTPACVARGRDCLDRLHTLRQQGWLIDLIRGNREMAAGRRLEVATGCRLRWPRLDCRLGPRQVRIVHGDRLVRDPGHAFLDVHMRGFWLQAMRGALPGFLQELLAQTMRRASRRKHLRHRRRREGEQAMPLDPSRVRAAARDCDSLVAGHVHRCWHRQIAGVDCYLVGEWTATQGSWVAGYADGRLVQRRQSFTGHIDPSWVAT